MKYYFELLKFYLGFTYWRPYKPTFIGFGKPKYQRVKWDEQGQSYIEEENEQQNSK